MSTTTDLDVVFSERLLSVDTGTIAAQIARDGFYAIEGGLTSGCVSRMLADVAANDFGINRNWVSGVHADRQYYLTHMLACSRTFVQFAAHPFVFALADRMLGEHYRLKASRYYETYGRHHMQWHTDNKTERGFARIPGLIFIAYLCDVHDGQFQYVRGSHHWSGESGHSDYTDQYVREKLAKDVVDFTGPAGTLVVYDTYGIHRAKPVSDPAFVRKSIFFQVDASNVSAEALLLNPSYLDRIDVRTVEYFGFGQEGSALPFPQTGLKTLRAGPMGRGLSRWVAQRGARVLYRALPVSLRRRLQRPKN